MTQARQTAHSPHNPIVKGWKNKSPGAKYDTKTTKWTKSSNNNAGVFAVPLTQSIKYAHSRISFLDDHSGDECHAFIPIVIGKCGAFLKSEALHEMGIFRLSGNAKRIASLQQAFDTPTDYGLHLDWKGYTVHDASNIMRRFLSYLPEPVIKVEYQLAFKNILDQPDGPFSSTESKIEAFQSVIEKHPIEHQYLLFYLLDMLYLFVINSDKTMMDLSALATAFAPGILVDPNDSMNPARYKEAQGVLEFLIEHQNEFSIPTAVSSEHYPVSDQYGGSGISIHSTVGGSSLVYPNDETTYSELHSHFSEYSLPGRSNSASEWTSVSNDISNTNTESPHSSVQSKPSLRRNQTDPSSMSSLRDEEEGYTKSDTNVKRVGRWKSIKYIMNEFNTS